MVNMLQILGTISHESGGSQHIMRNVTMRSTLGHEVFCGLIMFVRVSETSLRRYLVVPRHRPTKSTSVVDVSTMRTFVFTTYLS